jgi:hypothetical protein
MAGTFDVVFQDENLSTTLDVLKEVRIAYPDLTFCIGVTTELVDSEET